MAFAGTKKKKSKPTRTREKKSERPTFTKTKKVGAPDTKGPTAAELMSQGVDPGLAAGVVASRTPKKVGAPIVASKPVRPAGMPSFLTHTPSAGFGGAPPSIQTTGGGISDVQPDIIKGDIPPDTDGDGGTPPDTEKEKKFYIANVGKVNKRLYDYYQGLLKRMEHKEAIKSVKLKQIEDEWAEKNLKTLKETVTEKGLFGLPVGPLGILKGALQKPPYEKEFLGSAGAANILNQLEKIKGKTDKETAQLKQNYVNQIIEANPEGASKMFGIDLQYGNITPESFEKTLVSSNQGNKNFDMNYHKTVGAYWDVNAPQTQGDQESMANAFQQGNLKMTKANTLAIQQAVDAKSRMEDASNVGLDRIGGGQPATDPIDPDADPDKPYGNLTFDVYGRPIKKYDYTGGPEQLYLGGGWKKDGSFAGSPWGPNPHLPQFGPVPFKAGGIANFKPYGY